MKLRGIFALFALSVVTKGAWWAVAVQPLLLSIGTVFAALDLDLEPIQWRNLIPLLKKQEKIPNIIEEGNIPKLTEEEYQDLLAQSEE